MSMSKCKRERTPKQATAGGGRAIGLDPVYTDKFLNGQIVYLCNPLTRNQILLHVYTIQTKCIFQSVFNVQEIKVMSYTGTSFYLLCINCFDQNEQMKHPLL